MKNKLCMLLLASGIGLFSCAEQDLPKEYTDSVNVFIGTGGHGHTFPGATLPHGMVLFRLLLRRYFHHGLYPYPS